MQLLAAKIPRISSANLIGTTSPDAACHACAPVVRKAAPGKNGARWGGVFSMDDHRHATAAVLDQTEEEKFLTSTPSDEDLERAADGTPWAQTNTCVRTICFSEQSVRKAVVSQPINR
jgi:hypothetical protein